MNCPLCTKYFSQQAGDIPRVLIGCGHTLCQNCIQKDLPTLQIKCKQCSQISQGSSLSQFPVNATLISLLKQEAVCRVHDQKIEAYCQKDNELLCLTCIINGTHKSHKISPISQKVNKDRIILKQCSKAIDNSIQELNTSKNNCESELQRLEYEYKDYLLDLSLCFTTIRSALKELEDKCLLKVKSQYEKYTAKYRQNLEQISQKNIFMKDLTDIYQEVINLPNLQYLNEDNKRVFIMQNCKVKKNKVQSFKLQFSKNIVYSQVLSAIQDMMSFEKKLQNQATPGLKQKKTSRAKQPTILQVNLNEHTKKIKNQNQPIITDKGKKQKTVIPIKTPKQMKEKSNSVKESVPIAEIQNSGSRGQSQSFQIDAYLPTSMVHSFMESSESNFSMKGSDADFTVYSFESQVYHFGSFNDESVEMGKAGSKPTLLGSGIKRSKAQCQILSQYSPFKCLIFGGKSSSDQKLDTFLEFDLQTNQWRQSLFKLSEPKSGFGSAVKDNYLYVAGGSNFQKSLKNFQQYRLSGLGLCKTELSPMNHSRDQLCVILGFDGNLYACGGINQSGSVLSSCERYNWAKGRWEMISSMKKGRRCFSIASLPHGIYVIGGYNGQNYLSEVQLFDFTTQKWMSISSMNKARFAHTTTVSSDFQQIYVYGGFNNGPLKSVEKYNIVEQKWSQCEQMSKERFLHCSQMISF